MGRLPPQQDACWSHLAIPVRLHHWTAWWDGQSSGIVAASSPPHVALRLSSRISLHLSGGLCLGMEQMGLSTNLHTGAKLYFRKRELRLCMWPHVAVMVCQNPLFSEC